ncbi:hypothetical protein QEJ31_00850 [Pigmentibacter sp. JX0631]|uniref:hypothetical protein n=1 Tax=Pigmentibacter sp. JX0631 TaxID=2976982 RepID=UPI002469530E|nr:hypothetical protein [Pigmentibacter sp. JX0631]WGL60151.1 hypothetical protein QEJ31_00850 [Pigmentibacter sp. JX0631]
MIKLYYSAIALNFLIFSSTFADTFIPYSNMNSISLGSGYISNKQTATSKCINGKINYTGVNTAQEDFIHNASYKQIYDSLTGGVSGSLNFSYFNLNGKFDYASSTASNDLSLSYTDIVSITPKMISLNNYTLNPKQKDLLINKDGTTTDNVEVICGDQFIKQAVIGAKLFINIKFSFNNIADKKDFYGKIGANIYSIANIQGSLNVSDKKLLANTVVSIQAKQIGGDPSQLTTAIPEDSVYCSLDEQSEIVNGRKINSMQKCLDILESFSTYKQNFATQLINKNYDPSDSKGWAYFGWIATQYKNALLSVDDKPIQLIPKIPSPPLAQAIIDTRNKLKSAFDLQTKYSGQIADLFLFNLKASKINELKSLTKVISKNLDLISSAAEQCFGDEIIDCIETSNFYLKKMTPINEKLLQINEFSKSNFSLLGSWYLKQDNFNSFLNFSSNGQKVTSIVNLPQEQNTTILATGGFTDNQTLYLTGYGEKDKFKDNSKIKCIKNTSIKVKFLDPNKVIVQFKSQPPMFQYDNNCPIIDSDFCIFEAGDQLPITDHLIINPPICKQYYYSNLPIIQEMRLK